MKKQNECHLQILRWDMVLESDTPIEGWEANTLKVSTGGLWTREEQKPHINFLELLAAFLALKTFARDHHPVALLLQINNVSFCEQDGRSKFNPLLQSNHEAVLQQGHIHPCREQIGSLGMQGTPVTGLFKILQQLEEKLWSFTVDLFISRTNVHLLTYCSLRPNPHALAVDYPFCVRSTCPTCFLHLC